MKNKSGYFKGFLAILILSTAFFSCKKQASQIGLDVVDGNPITLLYSDTTQVEVHSVLRESVRTDEMSYQSLGVVVDPVFGKTKADLYIQYDLSLYMYSFGDNPVLDSIVLFMDYQGIPSYGDTTAALSFRVYQLDELLDYDTSYYSTQTAAYLPTILGEKTLVPRPYDSVMIDTTNVAPHFRVRLKEELGEYLMSFTLDDSVYYDNDKFVEFFKGLYFESVYTGGMGNLTFFNMYDTYSKIVLYYSNDTSDSLSYAFYPGSASAPSFQNFDHNGYAEADPDFYNQVINKDTTLGEEKFYLQTLGGVDAYVRFPSLFNREDYENYAINEAKLVITNIDPESVFAPAESMWMFKNTYSEADSTYVYAYVDDINVGEEFFDGTYNSELHQYEFRITNYIQNYIAGNLDTDYILLQILGANYAGARVIAGGPNNPDTESQIKLELLYTKINTDQE